MKPERKAGETKRTLIIFVACIVAALLVCWFLGVPLVGYLMFH
jgi:hypothetical protein